MHIATYVSCLVKFLIFGNNIKDYTVKNEVCIPHQLVYDMTLRSVNHSNYSVISTPQCHIIHHIFYSVSVFMHIHLAIF